MIDRVGNRAFWRVPIVITVAVLASGCGDSQGPAPILPVIPDLIVSNPVVPALVAGATVSPGDDGIVFVSLPRWSIRDGMRLLVAVRRTGATGSASFLTGGVDPVQVAAAAGDTLDVRIVFADGGVGDFMALVPASRRPVVVRTNPSARQGDVGLNTVLAIVFSEPIEPTTLTASSVRLTLAGLPVTGALAFRDSAYLAATFTPDQPLAAGGQYTLLLAPAIRDLEGDTLALADTVTFTAEDPGLAAPWRRP